MMHQASLYWHTVRYLRPAQIRARLWRMIHRPSFATVPPLTRRVQSGPWVMPARRMPSMPDDMTFCFLNDTRRIATTDWSADTPSLLWRYNLHYFDDLNALDAPSRSTWHGTAMRRWIAENPPGSAPAWDPYPTSLRIVNWIKASLGGFPFDHGAVESLAMQAGVLSQSVEYHLLGNHLFANAKALVFAGLFFEGSAANRWLANGMAILAREVPEQILADGGHFERSPMYHAIALEDIIDLINVTNAYPDALAHRWHEVIASWRVVARRMSAWLPAMCHPDGEISFFNDAALGIAPSPQELDRYASVVVPPIPAMSTAGSSVGCVEHGVLLTRHLADSGYVRAEAPDAVLLADVAPLGPDYQLGHAHADTLSFELSLFGQRVIVNGGTSQYGSGAVREAERGTRAHSTVVINGENSSEVWAGFRVARRARPFDVAVGGDERCTRVSCAHDGYRRLAGRPVHRRTWLLQCGSLRIEDRVEGRFRFAVARFHVHPAVQCRVHEGTSAGELRLPGGQNVRWRASGGRVHVERALHSSAFGRRESTQCLAIAFAERSEVSMQFTW